jgi:hypothetical protein
VNEPENTNNEARGSEERGHPRLRRVVRFTSWIGIAVLVVLAIVVIPSLVAFSPGFCRTCHQDEYKNWNVATHRNVTCTDCHVKANTWDALKARVGILDKLIIEVGLSNGNHNITGFEAKPLDQDCDVCHKLKRDVTPAGDLIIPHASHTKLRKLACVDCHKLLVHSAKSKQGNKPAMVGCYKCHDGNKAPNQCSSCHTEKALPQDHKAADWLAQHSAIQAQDPSYCEGCHGWVTDYCNECHKRKPRSHIEGWHANHQSLITSTKKEGCAKCHGAERCQSCHTKKKEVTHPKTY